MHESTHEDGTVVVVTLHRSGNEEIGKEWQSVSFGYID